MFLGTIGLQANLVRTGRHPPTHPPTHPGATHPGATHPPTHPPTHPGATNVFGHIPASAQFGPNSWNAKKESFWAHSGFSPIWSEQPECRKRMFLGTFRLQAYLVRTGRHPPTHPPTHPPGRHPPGRHPPNHQPTHPGATNVFGHIPASAQFGPNSQNTKKESFWAHSGFSPIWSEQPECQKRMFLGTFRLQPNLVRTAGMPKRNVFGHLRASGQFGPNGAPPTHPTTHPGTTHPGATHPPTHPPTRAPRMFLGTFRLQPNLVRTARMPKTNLFGHIRASAQFGPNSRNAEKECFWAPSGFGPIWSQPGATHPPTHPPGRHPPTHPPTRAPPTHPPTHPGATKVFGHFPASAQFGPNSRKAKNESFWAHSDFSPIWSEQPERQKRIFLGTFGLRPNLVRTAGMPQRNVFGHIRDSGQFGPNRAPPTHPGATHPPTHPPTHPGATNVFGHIPASAQFRPNSQKAKKESFWAHSGFSPIWSEQPECRKRMFLGTFGLRPNLVRTAGMPKTNVFGHIRASGQFGPNWAPPTHPPTHPPGRHPAGRHPTTHPPTHPPGRHECFWAHSGFSPIWSEWPERQKRIFLGTFGLQPNLVRTAGMPKTNVFGHIPASGQFDPNRAPPTHPPTRAPPTQPPTHPPGRHECYWAHSGFSPIWSEQPECQKRIFLGTFGLQPNLVRTAGMPKTNLFWHIRASAQFGPNSRNAEKECFWAPSGFWPSWSKRGATHPPTHPPGRHPPGRYPPTHPPTRAPRMFLGTFRLQPNLVRTAGMPKTNLFGHIRASAQFGVNSRNAENECFWAHSGFSPIWCKPGATHPPGHPPTRAPPTRAPPTHPPTHPPGRHECFWAHSGFSPIWSEQPDCQKRIFLGTFGLEPNLVRTAGMPKTNLFGHIRASAQFGPNSRNAENECFWAQSGFRPIWSEPGATHPPTHPGTPTHPPTHQPTRAPQMFLGTFRLQPNLVRTAGMPEKNLFGHIRASAQFGPNSRNAENECFWAHSGFRPIWSELGATHPPTHPPTHPGATHPGATHPTTNPPTRAPRMFLGTFRLQPNLVRTARIPKKNLFGHIRASGQFGPNSRNAEKECFWAPSGFWPIWSKRGATHPPTHPPGRHPPGCHPPTHPPTHPGGTKCFWARSGFSPIWSEQPECQKQTFSDTFGLQPNLVRTAGLPKTNVFGHIRASAQFGPNRAPPTHQPTHVTAKMWPFLFTWKRTR